MNAAMPSAGSDVPPPRAEQLHGEHGERDADDDRAAAVGSELRSRRSSRARARRSRGTRAGRSACARSAAPSERGEEEPRLEQVRDAEEAARQLGPDRRERQRRRSDEHRRRRRPRAATTSATPSCVFRRKNVGPKQPARDRAEPEQRHARRRVAGREPAHHEVDGDRAIRARSARRAGRRARRTRASESTSTEPAIVVLRATSI